MDDGNNPTQDESKARATAEAPRNRTLLKPLLHDPAAYSRWYKLRRDASTMQANTLAWLTSNAATACASALDPGAHTVSGVPRFELLSIGCGDGDMDIAITRSIQGELEEAGFSGGADITGLDIDEAALALYSKRLAQLQSSGDIDHRITFTPSLQAFPWAKGEAVPTADVVVMAHVLHFFPDPERALAAALEATRPGGCFILVQQNPAGVPQLQKQLRVDLAGDLGVYYTADEAQALLDGPLVGAYSSYKRLMVPGYLDMGPLASGSKDAVPLMSFTLHVDMREASEEQVAATAKAFLALGQKDAEKEREGGPFLPDGVSVFVIVKQ